MLYLWIGNTLLHYTDFMIHHPSRQGDCPHLIMRDRARSTAWISPSETFLAISLLIMARFSKFKISLEAEKALYLFILVGQRYANKYLHTFSWRPWAWSRLSSFRIPGGDFSFFLIYTYPLIIFSPGTHSLKDVYVSQV